MPDPIPAMLLARLAIDVDHQGTRSARTPLPKRPAFQRRFNFA
jgi:hypothetical protein